MNKTVVDIVNFNADASCFSSEQWIDDLRGGATSRFYMWLSLYVQKRKKISLGLTGATVADVKYYNPESIEYINRNPGVFEIILRPWSHDVGIFRSNDSFLYNVGKGIQIISKEFTNVVRYFLSPEFMINSKQIELLNDFEIRAIFINPNRYDEQTAERISKSPYEVLATSETFMKCISIEGGTTKAFLKSIQQYDDNIWNQSIQLCPNVVVYAWRDGESGFLLTDGIKRENFWLDNEDVGIKRSFLKDLDIRYVKNSELRDPYYRSYPIHSFLAWMQEMKMMWYINKVSEIEKDFSSLDEEQKGLFLQLINSDILASVEKKSPIIDLVDSNGLEKHVIHRQEKGFEGEEYLSIFNGAIVNKNTLVLKKLEARKKALKNMRDI